MTRRALLSWPSSLSLDQIGGLRAELAMEADFYGLLDRVMPYFAQEEIGVALLKRACVTGRGFHSSTCQLILNRFRH